MAHIGCPADAVSSVRLSHALDGEFVALLLLDSSNNEIASTSLPFSNFFSYPFLKEVLRYDNLISLGKAGRRMENVCGVCVTLFARDRKGTAPTDQEIAKIRHVRDSLNEFGIELVDVIIMNDAEYYAFTNEETKPI